MSDPTDAPVDIGDGEIAESDHDSVPEDGETQSQSTAAARLDQRRSANGPGSLGGYLASGVLGVLIAALLSGFLFFFLEFINRPGYIGPSPLSAATDGFVLFLVFLGGLWGIYVRTRKPATYLLYPASYAVALWVGAVVFIWTFGLFLPVDSPFARDIHPRMIALLALFGGVVAITLWTKAYHRWMRSRSDALPEAPAVLRNRSKRRTVLTGFLGASGSIAGVALLSRWQTGGRNYSIDTPDGLEVDDLRYGHRADESEYHVSGIVENVSKERIGRIEVGARFFDGNGNHIMYTSSDLSDIGAGETASFSRVAEENPYGLYDAGESPMANRIRDIEMFELRITRE